MLQFKKITAVSAAILLSSAIGASAATVTLLDSSTNGAGNTADMFAGTYNGSTPVGASWSGAAPVVTPPPGSLSGAFLSPFANTSLADTQSYFSVGGHTQGGPSPMTLTFGSAIDSINLLWGSIDDYNTLELFDSSNSLIASYTGSDVNNTLFGLGGTAPSFNNVLLLNFAIDAGDNQISSMTFSSGQAAFEFAVEAVPLPAAAWMLITGLAGLGFVSRRRAKS